MVFEKIVVSKFIQSYLKPAFNTLWFYLYFNINPLTFVPAHVKGGVY